MPGPDPDDSQLRPEPRDAALSLSVRSLKVHRASSRACVQQDCIPSMPRKGGSGWRAPGGGGGKPGSGTFPGKRPPHQDLEQGDSWPPGYSAWLRRRLRGFQGGGGVHEREGTQKDGDREEGTKSMDSFNGGLGPSLGPLPGLMFSFTVLSPPFRLPPA